MTGRIVPAARLDISADHRASHEVRTWLAATLTDDLDVAERQVANEICLAVHEVWANIVEHAYRHQTQGVVTITAARESDSIAIQLLDNGAEFDPTRIPTPDPDDPHGRGRGLYLVRSLVDALTYENTPAGNRWRLVKRVTG